MFIILPNGIRVNVNHIVAIAPHGGDRKCPAGLWITVTSGDPIFAEGISGDGIDKAIMSSLEAYNYSVGHDLEAGAIYAKDTKRAK